MTKYNDIQKEYESLVLEYDKLEELLYEKEDREYSRFSNYDKSNFYQKSETKTTSDKDELTSFDKKKIALENGSIEYRQIMNSQEKYIYDRLLYILSPRDNNIIIAPQVSGKAFIKPSKDNTSDDIWTTYSNFYVDFLIAHYPYYDAKNKNNKEVYSNQLMPICVIEFFGGKHYGDIDDDRLSEDEKKIKRQQVINNDNIKQEVMDKLGLKLFIITIEDVVKKDNEHYIDQYKLDKIIKEQILPHIKNIINR